MKTYRILKNNETKFVQPGCILADGTLRFSTEQIPVVLAAECDSRGLDAKKVKAAAAPSECLARLGMNAGGVEIVEEEIYQVRLADARRIAAEALEAALPGLTRMSELERKTVNESDRAHHEFEKMMADENNDGVNPPRAENRTFAQELAALRTQHPRTDLYLRAQKQAQGTTSYSATSGQMKGGDDAKKILLEGGTLEAAELALAFRYSSNFD